LDGLLVYDPAGRVSAKQAYVHEYFNNMHLNGHGSYPNMTNARTANGFHA
jgi:hypothetical protein